VRRSKVTGQRGTRALFGPYGRLDKIVRIAEARSEPTYTKIIKRGRATYVVKNGRGGSSGTLQSRIGQNATENKAKLLVGEACTLAKHHGEL